MSELGKEQIAIFNFLGRSFLGDYGDPLRTIDRSLAEIGEQDLAHFSRHACGSDGEKIALANYLSWTCLSGRWHTYTCANSR